MLLCIHLILNICIKGKFLSYVSCYLHYIYYNYMKKKTNKSEHMLRIEYNVLQTYAERMAAQSKKQFRFDNVLLLGIEGSNVF